MTNYIPTAKQVAKMKAEIRAEIEQAVNDTSYFESRQWKKRRVDDLVVEFERALMKQTFPKSPWRNLNGRKRKKTVNHWYTE